uniref:Uncharacterized protein n=1 Tax=Arundo donax TaxID=35708 RepID=A0A0A9AL29_ARUDO
MLVGRYCDVLVVHDMPIVWIINQVPITDLFVLAVILFYIYFCLLPL